MSAPYGPGKVRDADEFFARIRALCTSGGRKYIYAYWDEPDSLMHDTGCRSQEANAYTREKDPSNRGGRSQTAQRYYGSGVKGSSIAAERYCRL